MPDYLIIEKKLGPVRAVEDLPVVTADSEEDACRAHAESVRRAGTYYAVPREAVVEVAVEAQVERTYIATRVTVPTAPAA